MRRPRVDGAALALLTVVTCAHAQEPAPVGATGASCAAEPDDAKRLACYDAVFRAAHPAPAEPVAASAPTPAALPATASGDLAPIQHSANGTLSAGEVLNRF